MSLAVASRMNQPAKHRETGQELDELTLRRAQRGEEEACRALVLRYQRPVFALLSRMVGPGRQALVEDLAQETFLQVFRGLSGFSPLGRARLSTWILTIASRRAVDELRKSRPAGAPLEAGERVSAPEVADEAARQKQAAEAIQRAIEELSPAFRAAFLLREYHEMEYGEIARALRIDLGTVKSRLARAREAVRRNLAEVLDD